MAIDPASGYPYTPEGYAEFAGGEALQSFQYIKDLDSAMRANYATNIVSIGQNIYPLLYVESTFDGGRYTLLIDKNTRHVHQNVGQKYDVMKAVAHIPLGIFSIISGYSQYPAFGQWIPGLEAYREQILKVQGSFQKIPGLNLENKIVIDIFLQASLSYINTVLSDKTFALSGFSEYTRQNEESIGTLQQWAAENQVAVMKGVLEEWKALLGEERWDAMYVIIGAIWTLTVENAHELIIKSLMKPDLRETHVVVSEAVPDLESAQTLMGRIVGDRIMSELVFDAKAGKAYAENIYSLSTRRDLLSQAVEAIVGDVASAAVLPDATVACPHLQR